jgi:hypothetical protein
MMGPLRSLDRLHRNPPGTILDLRQGVYELLGKWGQDGDAHSEVLSGFKVAVHDRND